MNIGDKVRFLNDVGGGTVTGFQGKDLVLVCTDDGFDIPTPINECVVIDTNEYNIAKKATSPAPSPLKKTSPANEPREGETDERPITFRPRPLERRGADTLNLTLAFVPQSVADISHTRFELYIVNDCNYTIRFCLSSTDETGCTLIEEGEVEANTKRLIDEFGHDSLSRYEHLAIQAYAFKRTKPFAAKSPIVMPLRIDATKFFRSSAFNSSPFFTKPALLVDIMKDDRPARTPNIDPQAILQAMTTPSTAPARISDTTSERRDPKAPLEIDLHAHELLETMSGLTPKDILDFQLKTFHDTMKEHIKERGRRIVFIHGKGEGVLRAAIISELKAHYKQCRWQDASFCEYGYGATLVTL